jgi:Flp pilus assembly pilin Flp
MQGQPTVRGLRRLLADERGQDLVEYALLTAIVMLLAAITLPLASSLGDIYEAWNSDVNELWQAPPPTGS